MQHITPNSKRWDYSDIPGGSHGQIKGPAHMVEGGHHPRNRPPTLGTMSVDFYHYPVTVWAYSTPQPNTEVPAPTGGLALKSDIGCNHYRDVTMSAMAYQITAVSIVCLTVCSGTVQRKHQSSASLAFMKGIHQWLVYSPHKGPVTQKMFPFDDITMTSHCLNWWRPNPQYHMVSMSSIDFSTDHFQPRMISNDSCQYHEIKNNAWVTVNNDFWVTSEAICQWFSRVTKSRVKIIGKSHHEWPQNRYWR